MTPPVETPRLVLRPFSEVAQASLDFGFERCGLHAIIALVHPDNQRSIRVAEKLRMSFVGQEQYFGMTMNKYRRHNILIK